MQINNTENQLDIRPKLYLKALKYKRDAQNLFDQDTLEVKQIKFAIDNECWLYENENSKFYQAKMFEQKSKSKWQGKFIWNKDKKNYSFMSKDQILNLQEDELNFYTKFNSFSQKEIDNLNQDAIETIQDPQLFDSDQMYQIVRNSVNNTAIYQPKAGDLIKLGRIKIQVTEIKFNNQITKMNTIQSRSTNCQIINEKHQEKCIQSSENGEIIQFVLNESEHKCRICLDETFTELNPLINCCKCKGSVQFQHLNCLLTDIRANTHKTDDKIVEVNQIKKKKCELCNTRYPQEFRFNGIQNQLQIISSQQTQRPDSDQMMLQILQCGESKRDLEQYQYLIKLNDELDVAKVGRSGENHIRIQDPTVSRVHNFIGKDSNGFQIEDNSSRYGTLVRLTEGLEIGPNDKGKAVQMGRMLITFSFDNAFNYIQGINFQEITQNATLSDAHASNDVDHWDAIGNEYYQLD